MFRGWRGVTLLVQCYAFRVFASFHFAFLLHSISRFQLHSISHFQLHSISRFQLHSISRFCSLLHSIISQPHPLIADLETRIAACLQITHCILRPCSHDAYSRSRFCIVYVIRIALCTQRTSALYLQVTASLYSSDLEYRQVRSHCFIVLF